MLNLPGIEEYYCHRPWMFKQRGDGLLAADLFFYMDNGRRIEPTENLCWEPYIRWGLKCLWLGIQEDSRNVQPPSQALWPWAGTSTNTEVGVHGLVSQERRDTTQWLIEELEGMEREGRYGMYRASMESIRSFLVCVSRTYREITPYLKGVHLTMYSWIPYSDD